MNAIIELNISYKIPINYCAINTQIVIILSETEYTAIHPVGI